MTLKEHFYLIRRKILRKNNIVFILAMIILLLILFISLGVTEFFLSYKINSGDKDISIRSLNVFGDFTDENKEKIKNIEHVTFVDSTRLARAVITDVKELDKSSSKASISILPIIDDNQLKVVAGKKEISNGEALCPIKFNPYYGNDLENVSVSDGIINGKDVIGKTITSVTVKDYILKPEEEYRKEFTIVGVYDQSYNMASLDRCYITKEDFLEIASPYSGGETKLKDDGTLDVTYSEYNDFYVVVDDFKNMSYVMQELNKLGFGCEALSDFDEETSYLFVIVPLFISLVIMIVAINIIHNFNSKKMKQRTIYYGLLKAIGYDNKTIEKNQLLENMVCYMISFVISFIILIVGFVFIKKYLLAELIFEGYVVSFPLFVLIIGLLITIGILILINKKMISKKLKLSVGELIRDEI